MKIAQVYNLQESIPPLNKNGLEQLVNDLTEELVKLGHDVTLFGTADSKTSAKLVPVWPKAISRDPLGSLVPSIGYSILAVSEAFLRHKEFDIIHSHVRFTAANFAGVIDTPVVTTMHHPTTKEVLVPENYPQEYQKFIAEIWHKHQMASHSVVVSKFQQTHLETPSTVIHNGIPLELWTPSFSPGEYVVFLGYITSDKGAAEAVQAILPTKERLIIAGPIREDDPVSQKYFEEKIKPYLSNRIQYVGGLNYDQKKGLFKKAKATLMPIQWDEPFGLVAIESMASGTPVIAQNRAAMPEIIEDGVSGFLVNSVSEMTQRIGQIDSLRRENARKQVEEKFSARKMAENYVKLYEEIIKQKG